MNIVKEGTVKYVEATKMSIQRNGSFAVFCGQYDALLINLNDHKIRMQSSIGKTSKEITVCQWSKFGDNIAIGVNNVCKVFDSEMKKLESLKGHNMSISSIDWHPSTKNCIISGSYDKTKSICIWDIRKAVAPVAKNDSSAVQQIKWHKFNTHIFASTSDSDIQIWDQRNISSPINNTSAHSSYVSGFDWLPREDYCLISCGQYDQKLKSWNFNDDHQSLKCQIDENASMSHCKLNLSGNKLMTITIPNSGPENQFILWDISLNGDVKKRLSSPFTSNTIVDFDWRICSTDKCQIVSLHRNFDFKIWDVDANLVGSKQITKDSSVKRSSISNDRFYLSQSPISFGDVSNNFTTVFSETFTSSKINENLENMLPRYSDSNLALKSRVAKLNDINSKIQKEFDRFTNSAQVTYEKIPNDRSVIAQLNLINARCSILFTYQNTGNDGVSLDASIIPEKSDKLRKQNLDELEKLLKNTANKNVFGISKCIDAAMDYINKLSARVSIRSVRAMKDSNSGSNFYFNLPDVRIPYPRTCGATFSASGHLVCFLLPTGYQNKFHTTPRSYVDVAKHSNPAGSGKDLYYGYNVPVGKVISHRSSKTGSRKNKALEGSGDIDYSSRIHSLQNLQKHNFTVYIYNAQRLSLFCPDLAKKYSIDISDVDKMCEQNAMVVSEFSRKDLTEFWQYCILLSNASRPNINDFTNKIKPWPSQLLGRHMCSMWLEHFMKLLDIQSAAMLILVMMAIDARFDADFETKYNLSMILGNKKNISPEYNQETQCADNNSMTSLNSFVNITFDGIKVYKVYDDKSNSALIISDSSFESGHSRFYGNNFNDLEQQATSIKRPDKWSDMFLRHRECCRLIESTKLPQYGLIMIHYARMLSAQNLLTAATKISRKVLPWTFFNNLSIQDQFAVRFIHAKSDNRLDNFNNQLICTDYSQRNVISSSISSTRHQELAGTKSQTVLCSICRLSVHGLLSLCSQCNHGGHMSHISAWFARNNSSGLCPTGCGCQCSMAIDNTQEVIMPPILT